MSKVVGQPVNVEFRLLEDEVETTQVDPRPTVNISARQRMRNAYDYPLVRKATEFFGAEVIRVEAGERADP